VGGEVVKCMYTNIWIFSPCHLEKHRHEFILASDTYANKMHDPI